MTVDQRQLVLASTSVYRGQLLERLGLPFACDKPEVDETPYTNEGFRDTALRLSRAKAQAVATRWQNALVIGSDQVASCNGVRLDKPGTHEAALTQLRHASGKHAEFLTAVTVIDTGSGRSESRVVPCRVEFRDLDEARIENYLRREQPYDCAGSAKSEGLGIALMKRIECDDPTALIGLPLIATCEMLVALGLDPLR